MERISPPVRIFAIVIVLVGVAGMLAMRTMGPSTEPVAIPLPAQAPAKAATNVQPAKAASSAPAPQPKPLLKPAPKPVNPVVPPSGFPVAVDRALRQHEVVVAALLVADDDEVDVQGARGVAFGALPTEGVLDREAAVEQRVRRQRGVRGDDDVEEVAGVRGTADGRGLVDR